MSTTPAATDIGPGPYTVMTMLAAESLGMPIDRVPFGLGDSEMPKAPQQGGSGLRGALGNAVQAECVKLVGAFLDLVNDDAASPITGCRLKDVAVRDGKIQATEDPARYETYSAILTRHALDEHTIEAESTPPNETSSATMVPCEGRFVPFTAPSTGSRAHAGAYAAHFVEVHVDPDLGTVRVTRVVSAIDGGRILNPKTARSQIIRGKQRHTDSLGKRTLNELDYVGSLNIQLWSTLPTTEDLEIAIDHGKD